MLRSKFHRPWQPRVSDSQQFNPFAHTSESETSFSDEIEEVETEIHAGESADASAAASSNDTLENVETLPSAAPDTPATKPRWLASLVERFARH